MKAEAVRRPRRAAAQEGGCPGGRLPRRRQLRGRRFLVVFLLGLAVAAAEAAEAGREIRRGRGCAGGLVRLRYPEGRVRGGQGLQARGVVVGAAGERAQSAGDPRTSLTGNRSGESQAGGATADPAAGDSAAGVTAERTPIDPPAGHSPAGLAAGPTAAGPTTAGHLAAGPTATGHLAAGPTATGHLASGGVATGTSPLRPLLL